VHWISLEELSQQSADFGLYVSPVGFSSAIVPEKWKQLYALNTMVGVIELGDSWPRAFIDPTGFWRLMAIVALLAITGVR
jgi:lipopolysaccharide transport system permease protein